MTDWRIEYRNKITWYYGCFQSQCISFGQGKGGIKIMNLEIQLQALLSNEPQKWKAIATWYLEEYLRNSTKAFWKESV